VAVAFYAGYPAAVAAVLLLRSPSLDISLPAWTTAMEVFTLAAMGWAVRAGVHPNLDARTRRAWLLVAVSFGVLAVSAALFQFVPGGRAFPTAGDIARLLFVPVMLVALLSFPLRAVSPWAAAGAAERRDRYKIGLDVATVIVAGSMALWYLVVGPGISEPRISDEALAAAIAYPVGDLALIFGVVTVLFRGASESVRLPLRLLALAMLVLVAGDTYLGYQRSHPGFQAPAKWQFLCWLTGHYLMAMAALVQCRLASGQPHGKVRLPSRGRPRGNGLLSVKRASPEAGRGSAAWHGQPVVTVSLLPYLSIALGYGLLLAVAAAETQVYPWVGLVCGAAAITTLAVARQIIALRENHELAITDGLTGLHNRAYVHDVLSRALARGQRGGELVAVLLVDLDGLKQINDTRGHRAGDQLLVAFGGVLRRSVLGSDVVGRLGGDEFAVVLQDIGTPGNAEAVARRIVLEMDQPVVISGGSVRLRAGIGIALSGPDELGPDELLHRADVAMYHAKRRKTSGYERYDETADRTS
jgi:diguanylate cyclase (GGDEF)-like protein